MTLPLERINMAKVYFSLSQINFNRLKLIG